MAIQDFKSFSIWWFLPLFFGLAGFYLNYYHTPEGVLAITIAGNIVFLIGVTLIVLLSKKLIPKREGLYRNFGLGDIVFVFAMTFCFSIFPFMIFLGFGMLFAAVMALVRKNYSTPIPLVGYMSLFLIGAYPVAWFYSEKIIYI